MYATCESALGWPEHAELLRALMMNEESTATTLPSPFVFVDRGFAFESSAFRFPSVVHVFFYRDGAQLSLMALTVVVIFALFFVAASSQNETAEAATAASSHGAVVVVAATLKGPLAAVVPFVVVRPFVPPSVRSAVG